MMQVIAIGPGISVGRYLPDACIVGDRYFQTDVPGGARYECTATNTWTRINVMAAIAAPPVPVPHSPMTETQGWLVIGILLAIMLLLAAIWVDGGRPKE